MLLSLYLWNWSYHSLPWIKPNNLRFPRYYILHLYIRWRSCQWLDRTCKMIFNYYYNQKSAKNGFQLYYKSADLWLTPPSQGRCLDAGERALHSRNWTYSSLGLNLNGSHSPGTIWSPSHYNTNKVDFWHLSRLKV